MRDAEGLAQRVAKRLDKIEEAARDETFWKRRLADTVLAMLRGGEPVTITSLRERLTTTIDEPIAVAGTALSIEFSREASLAAIAGLDELTRVPEDDPDKKF